MTLTTANTAIERIPVSGGIDKIMEIYRRDGAIIIQGMLTKDQVRRFNAEMDAPLAETRPGTEDRDPATVAYHGAQTRRLTNIISHSRVFREELIDYDLFHAIGEAVFRAESGDWWLSTAQLIEIGPGNAAQPLHRDIEPYVGFLSLGRAGPEIMANLLYALVDFTAANGATRIILGSNRWDNFGERGTPEMTIPAEMSAGDALLFSGKVVHGGGANVTSNEHRRALAVPMQPCYLTPGEAYPIMIRREITAALPLRVQRLLALHPMYPRDSPPVWNTKV